MPDQLAVDSPDPTRPKNPGRFCQGHSTLDLHWHAPGCNILFLERIGQGSLTPFFWQGEQYRTWKKNFYEWKKEFPSQIVEVIKVCLGSNANFMFWVVKGLPKQIQKPFPSQCCLFSNRFSIQWPLGQLIEFHLKIFVMVSCAREESEQRLTSLA